MSDAVIASTTVSLLRLMFWEFAKLWRMPVTTISELFDALGARVELATLVSGAFA
jgi:hypothetical protein